MDTLDASKITAALNSDVKQQIPKLIILDSVDSTNNYLLELAKSETPIGTICLAKQQTVGRGQLEKTWFAPDGNIYLSLLWPHNCDSAKLSLIIGVVIIRALVKYGVDQQHLKIRWPNDVLWQQRKLAGTLIEIYQRKAVIGIGLNLKLPAEAAQQIDQPFTSVADICNKVIDLNAITALLINELISTLEYIRQYGAAKYLAAWQDLDMLRNKKIEVTTPTQQYVGIAKGINERGELVIDTGKSIELLASGTIRTSGTIKEASD